MSDILSCHPQSSIGSSIPVFVSDDDKINCLPPCHNCHEVYRSSCSDHGEDTLLIIYSIVVHHLLILVFGNTVTIDFLKDINNYVGSPLPSVITSFACMACVGFA